MSWLGGPLPGTGEKIGLDPVPKFDPDYGDFYDGGGWTETIIGPDMSEEIYRGTIGDSRWNEDINGGIANVDEWLQMIEDKGKENQFLDTAKGIGGPLQSGMQAYNIPGTDITLTKDGQPISGYGSSAAYSNLSALTPGGFRPAGSSLGITDIAKIGASFGADKLKHMAYAALPGGQIIYAVDKLYPGGIPGAFKDVTRFAGDVGNTIASGIGGVVRGIGSLFCDERLKVDIAPLERTEVNDELAQMAFFVKGIRECS